MKEPLHEFDHELSAAGMERRQAILRLALKAARGKVRRRWTRTAIVALLACVVLSTLTRWRRQGGPVIAHNDARPSASDRPILIARVTTDPDIWRRLAAAPEKPAWQSINDEQLLDRLGAMGQAAALAYVNGRPVLVLQPQQVAEDQSPQTKPARL